VEGFRELEESTPDGSNKKGVSVRAETPLDLKIRKSTNVLQK
jgi:hypothetical protein